MNPAELDEKYQEQRITYTLEVDGQLVVVENVPARINVETGEQLFGPETVDRLQQTVWGQKPACKDDAGARL